MTKQVEEHREVLQAVAESDLETAWIAETLLEAVDDEDSGR